MYIQISAHPKDNTTWESDSLSPKFRIMLVKSMASGDTTISWKPETAKNWLRNITDVPSMPCIWNTKDIFMKKCTRSGNKV